MTWYYIQKILNTTPKTVRINEWISKVAGCKIYKNQLVLYVNNSEIFKIITLSSCSIKNKIPRNKFDQGGKKHLQFIIRSVRHQWKGIEEDTD